MTQLTYVYFIVSLLVSYGVARIILPSILKLITEAGYVRANFRGDAIPVGVGLVFFISVLLPTSFVLFLNTDRYQPSALLFYSS